MKLICSLIIQTTNEIFNLFCPIEARAELGKYFVHFLEDQVNLLLRFSDLVQVDDFQNIHLFTNLSIVKFERFFDTLVEFWFKFFDKMVRKIHFLNIIRNYWFKKTTIEFANVQGNKKMLCNLIRQKKKRQNFSVNQNP